MTLGRTADNKIKIKTDGGIRAVECACCAPPCECPDSPGSPFVPPIAGEFEIDASWSATVYRAPYSACGTAYSILADGTDLALSWRCFGAWYIFSVNPNSSLPPSCQNQFASVFSASPVGTFQLFPEDTGCEGRYVTVTQVA
jgi:hypothetical protein